MEKYLFLLILLFATFFAFKQICPNKLVAKNGFTLKLEYNKSSQLISFRYQELKPKEDENLLSSSKNPNLEVMTKRSKRVLLQKVYSIEDIRNPIR